MRLLLIRHGDRVRRHDQLTEAGRAESAYLAERLAQEEIDQFFVSPLSRAQDTAAPTLAATGMEATTCDWLGEFYVSIARPDKEDGRSHIPWDWLPEDWLQRPMLSDPERWRDDPVMAEGKVGEAYDLVTSQFDEVLANNGYVRDGLLYRAVNPNTQTLAFVCHLGVMCVLLSHLMHCSPLVLMQGLCPPPSSVSIAYSEERRKGKAIFRIATIGDTSHLYRHRAKVSHSGRFCEVYGDGDRID